MSMCHSLEIIKNSLSLMSPPKIKTFNKQRSIYRKKIDNFDETFHKITTMTCCFPVAL